MYVKLIGLYGLDGHDAWYRKQGVYCFDFVHNKQFASDLTAEEVRSILQYWDWYCKQYNAKEMEVCS